jgi:hypothetical protein
MNSLQRGASIVHAYNEVAAAVRAMLKDWHKNDIFEARRRRGWEGPTELPFSREQLYYVGEACSFQRSAKSVNLYIAADIGTGFNFNGEKSIESVVAAFEGDPARYDLWLHRARDSKWRVD